MKVLIACEFSGIVRDAFIDHGHDAWSCDVLPTERPGPHIQADVQHLVDYEQYDLMVAHPPCTYLTNAGVRHLHDHVTSRLGNRTAVYGEARWKAMREAAEFFNWLKHLPIPLIAIENPIPHRYAREIIGRYDQIIQPWQFGHGEIKRTCLWLKNLPPLIPTCIVEGRSPKCHHSSGWREYKRPELAQRWKERSRTYQGIADAMAEQWGAVCSNGN